LRCRNGRKPVHSGRAAAEASRPTGHGYRETRGENPGTSLDDFEHELAEILRDESDTLDAEFFEAIWREAEAEDAVGPRSPSPEPAASF
jgi:hypothetical protein